MPGRGARAGKKRNRVNNDITENAARTTDQGDGPRTPKTKRPSGRDSFQPQNWTISKLKEELERKGIKLPSSTPHKTLATLYEQLNYVDDASSINSSVSNNNSVINSTPDSGEPEFPADSVSCPDEGEFPGDNAHGLSSGSSNATEVQRINYEIRQMQANLAQISRRLDTSFARDQNGPTTNRFPLSIGRTDGFGESHSGYNERRPVDELPPVIIVPQKIRNDILSNRYVNLAVLLIPGMESSHETQIFDRHGEQVVIRAGDSRLHKTLNIHEFRAAFSKYKNIICEVDPFRRKELDAYADLIDSMHRQYGGNYFYEYHVAFARKAEQYEAQNIHVDWSACDTKLYLTTFSGLRSASCDKCRSTCHTTAFCPTSLNVPKESGDEDRASKTSTKQFSRNRTDRHGRIRKFHQGREICNNFNLAGCDSLHSNSNIAHICDTCKVEGHPAFKCPTKTAKQSNINKK